MISLIVEQRKIAPNLFGAKLFPIKICLEQRKIALNLLRTKLFPIKICLELVFVSSYQEVPLGNCLSSLT